MSSIINNGHPAPGFGALQPGWTLLPFNPISPGTPMVPSLGAAYPGQAVRIPRAAEVMARDHTPPGNAIMRAFGDLTPGSYPVPMNPILAGRGMGCAACQGMGGLGDPVTDSTLNWLSQDSPIAGVSNLVFWGGLIGGLWVFSEVRGATYGRRISKH